MQIKDFGFKLVFISFSKSLKKRNLRLQNKAISGMEMVK